MSDLAPDQVDGSPPSDGGTAAAPRGDTPMSGPRPPTGFGRLAAAAPNLPPWLPGLTVAAIVAAGVALRFISRSNLWMDEALSVNIAALGVADLLDALRHDGHPPLYYLLLHYWMELFGEGDTAVRALSGVMAVASLPLAWVAGRRLAGRSGARWAIVLVALSPYWIRYATETRMYALVMLLVMAGYLLLDSALARPDPARLAGLGLISGALLLSHYWAFWLLGAVGLALLARAWVLPQARAVTVRVLLAVAAGGVLFLPWLPSFIYQAQNTGTPWAGPMRPLAIAQLTLVDMGGGSNLNEAFFYGAGIVLALLLALFVLRSDGSRVTLDVRTVPGVRAILGVAGLTAAIGCVTAYVSSSTFQARYAAVFIPLLLLAAAYGLTRLPVAARLGLGGLLVALSLVGVGWGLYFERTQSSEAAAVVDERAGADDVVVYCPDQLGPAYGRAMPDRLVELAYPELDDPARVDWVDYQDRNAAADPQERAARVLEQAGDGDIFVVWSDGFATFGTQCQDLVSYLSMSRPTGLIMGKDAGRFYEPANVSWAPAP